MTCVAVKLDAGKLHELLCYGTDDLYGLVAQPAPYFKKPELIDRFYIQIAEKKWRER